MSFEVIKNQKSFSGFTAFCEHQSSITKTKMKFSYFEPANEVEHIIIWLSGLTCNEENFITKSGVQNILKNSQTMVICPDTSPRGLELKGEHDSYDFGSGAGFYLNSLTDEYKDNYKMDDYIIKELMPLLQEKFRNKSFSITGHSMGGHGALVLGLSNPDLFTQISAFSPIVNPINVPWGIKAFTGYLGPDKSKWKKYDACELIKNGNHHSSVIRIDQGLADDFLEEQLKTDNFVKVCKAQNQQLNVKFHEGYDHSYYFISTFLAEHLKEHIVSN